jgi:hypothetical protein
MQGGADQRSGSNPGEVAGQIGEGELTVGREELCELDGNGKQAEQRDGRPPALPRRKDDSRQQGEGCGMRDHVVFEDEPDVYRSAIQQADGRDRGNKQDCKCPDPHLALVPSRAGGINARPSTLGRRIAICDHRAPEG